MFTTTFSAATSAASATAATTPTPTASATATTTPTVSVTATKTPTASATATATKTPTASATATRTPTASATTATISTDITTTLADIATTLAATSHYTSPFKFSDYKDSKSGLLSSASGLNFGSSFASNSNQISTNQHINCGIVSEYQLFGKSGLAKESIMSEIIELLDKRSKSLKDYFYHNNNSQNYAKLFELLSLIDEQNKELKNEIKLFFQLPNNESSV